jgi:hypothetical protein
VGNGLVLSGGGGLIKGLDDLIEYSTGLRVTIAENALEAGAEGTGRVCPTSTSSKNMQEKARRREYEESMNWLREHRILAAILSVFLILTI